MKLFYYESGIGNFGDDLNPWLWSRIFPSLSSKNGDYYFVGIGTILDRRLDKLDKKVIFGAGVRGLGNLPKIDGDTLIYALRGYMSSKALGVDEERVITDPAILVRRYFNFKVPKKFKYSYMPYFESAQSEQWQGICAELGVNFIDPRASVDSCLEGISESQYLITEAMHGAIIADAFRVPWAPVQSSSWINEGAVSEFKWMDWLSTLELGFKPTRLPVFWPEGSSGLLRSLKVHIKKSGAGRSIRRIIDDQSFYLSEDGIQERHLARFDDVIEKFRNDFELDT